MSSCASLTSTVSPSWEWRRGSDLRLDGKRAGKTLDRIRVGVVGVGALGQHHARVYASLPQVELVGVVDSMPGRAAEIGVPLGATIFTDHRELFGKVDAVSIATPTTTHAPIGESFLNEGVHVLVEKPISGSIDAAQSLVAAAKRNDRVLQVGHLERFNPAVRALRGIVNDPRFFEAHRLGLFAPRSLDIDVILDLMIHDLDIISLLVPFPVTYVDAVGIAILSRRIDIANARIRFSNGCVANVTASRVSMEKIRKLRLFQSQHYISLDYTRQDVSVFSLGEAVGQSTPKISSYRITPPHQEPLRLELEAFVAAVQGRGPVECPGEEAIRALDLALQIHEHAERAQAREFDRR
ncbi:MAG: Gfo/Idh/MocA family oxidoreductase [Acidobacteria bacterium]|nr:Gfo/Idh/MocA family oxidoreductase [Acidobacteriota bacterium]